MPELPEVETIKRGLEKKIVGLSITRVEVLNKKSFPAQTSLVEGHKIIKVWRRAKMLGIDLDNDLSLLIHLKMSGQLILVYDHQRLIGGHPTLDMAGQMPNKATRVIFYLSKSQTLYFNDQRKFGWVKLLPTAKLNEQKELQALGPEPLEKSFTWEVLKDRLSKHPQIPIKVALMDQASVAGIGNIYASESLFLARIDPKRKINRLSDKDFQQLDKAIKDALNLSIKYGGSTRTHFVDAQGKKGRFLDFAHVYNREGQACHDCPGEVKRITQAGRSTFYCPSCQH
ncbi:bifunctional DNA-formamidopyrimidine glycosylase/DNA-(apurinic or apyrimidinic site) lyase [Patescibacteria group bacterium]|nr:bifunctional DNA-formamidopyrimidine glycosylase/DNA-(apurinic or apyrimidinic site) lyase [Patescibacteria group bacterium]MCL5409397.1 bifunctional DNA-formamidopyrimidine glycosylase/DNA-(apurinic or apyrimidinic site) lyase [Patescibacteria group bacterium]